LAIGNPYFSKDPQKAYNRFPKNLLFERVSSQLKITDKMKFTLEALLLAVFAFGVPLNTASSTAPAVVLNDQANGASGL